MTNPIVIAHHLIFTAYGWWLPNDPRGSTSRTIRNDVIADLGELHQGRKRLQPTSGDIRAFYREAGRRLQNDLLAFDERAVAAIAEGFVDAIASERYTCWGCAIMPDHVHLLIRKHKHLAEAMISEFQARSRKRLRERGLRAADHPIWGGPGFKCFLDHPDEVARVINYIQENPVKIGMPRQYWPFVKEYDNWPLHPGHSPDSPYAKGLRAVGRYP